MLGFNAHIPMMELLAFARKIKHPSIYTTIFVPFIDSTGMAKGLRDKHMKVFWICIKNGYRYRGLELLTRGRNKRVTDTDVLQNCCTRWKKSKITDIL
jgi:hypothetical protein